MAEREPTAEDQAFADILRSLEHDPATRGPLHDLMYQKDPKQAARYLPDVAVKEAAQPILAKIQEAQTRLDASEAKANQEAARRTWEANLLAAGFRADELKEANDLAHSKGIADPTALRLRYQQDRQVANPQTARRSSLVLPGSKGSGKYFEEAAFGGPSITQDWEKWRSERIEKDLQDLKAGRPLDPVS